ncbi:MAG: hypothetical protein Q4P11_05810 [Methanobrevibacter sp.]|nr:hypothetical protein [Methanobrevibacter sp.]
MESSVSTPLIRIINRTGNGNLNSLTTTLPKSALSRRSTNTPTNKIQTHRKTKISQIPISKISVKTTIPPKKQITTNTKRIHKKQSLIITIKEASTNNFLNQMNN